MRLTARSLLIEPSRSSTRAVGSPSRLCGCDADGDQVAVLRVLGGALRDRKLLAELLLVDRHEPAAAARQRAEDAERADLGLVDDLDDAPGVADASSSPVSSTRSSARSPTPATSPGRGLARGGDADLRHRAVGVLVPFGRRRDQLAVAVAAGDVGQRHGRQGAGVVQLLALGFDAAFVGQFAQHALELDAAVVLQIEGAGDLARADLPGLSPMKARISSLLGKGACLE